MHSAESSPTASVLSIEIDVEQPGVISTGG